MKFPSVCSGIEAASVAWHPLGWESVAYSEIEPFPCKVLQQHYPDVPNLGDMTKFKEWPDADVDVFVGGTPCQSFSVAGLRKGLDDPRGNLMLTFLAIAKQYRPNWLVWENVPGVLSSNGGRDFGSLLGGLAVLGYGFAYRVLDAQYFGVAQRRKRVFVVGYLGDWRPAAAVLFERHSLQGHPAPSRKAREGVAGTIKASVGTGGVDVEHPMVAVLHSEISPALKARDHKGPSSDGDGDGDGAILVPMQPSYGIPGNWIGRKPENGGNATEPMHDIAPCLTKADRHGVAQPIAHAFKVRGGCEGGGKGYLGSDDVAFTISTRQDQQIKQAMAVRRLTPVECERLQGFPDRYTDIQPKGKATPDGPRYKALGNSMAVPVMAWIGKRIQEVDAICKTQQNK